MQYPAFGVFPGGGQSLQGLGEVWQAHQQADGVVVLQSLAPERIQALGPLGLPVGLCLVEIRGTSLAHLVGDGLAPGQAGVAVGVVVQHIDQQRQLLHRLGVVQGLYAVFGRQPAGLRLRHLADRLIKVLGADASFRPRLQLPVAPGKDLNAAQRCHARSHPAHRHADARPVRVDCNGTVQGPGRCNGLARLCAGGVDVVVRGRVLRGVRGRWRREPLGGAVGQ